MTRRPVFVVSSILSGLMLLAACGGDDSPPPSNTGGSRASGGSGGSAAGGSGGSTDGGATSGGSGGSTSGGSTSGGASTGGATGDAGASSCTDVPGDGKITDFSADPDNWPVDTCVLGSAGCYEGQFWGNSATNLTGGVIQYKAPEATENPLTGDSSDGETLKLTGTITAGQYAGFGLWFGPACSDASAYTGFEITLSNADVPMPFQLQFQAQMSSNYPIDAENNRGSCEFTDENTKWSECSNNYFNLEEVGDTPAAIQIPFSELAGGTPNGTFDPTEVMGIQLQINCGETDCPVNLTIDEIRFY